MSDIPVLFEDESLLAVNKPAGLLVHGLAERSDISDQISENSDQKIAIRYQDLTLVDWFTKTYPRLADLNWPDRTRPGIVHRLDRDTSGVMIIAKNPEILASLQQQFQERKIKKTYLCLVVGGPEWEEKTIVAAIGRAEGTKRQAGYLKLNTQAKDAETFVKVIKTFKITNDEFRMTNSVITLIEARPLTGRTHQIRVHLGLENLPILADPWYQTKMSKKLAAALQVPRLMLHAQKLAFTHPTNRQEIILEAPLPADFNLILASLKPKR